MTEEDRKAYYECGLLTGSPEPFSPEKLFESVRDIITEKIGKYRRQAYVSPRFVKIPDWVFDVLVAKFTDRILVHRSGAHEVTHEFMGLMVCPTKAIFDISQIEVF